MCRELAAPQLGSQSLQKKETMQAAHLFGSSHSPLVQQILQ